MFHIRFLIFLIINFFLIQNICFADFVSDIENANTTILSKEKELSSISLDSAKMLKEELVKFEKLWEARTRYTLHLMCNVDSIIFYVKEFAKKNGWALEVCSFPSYIKREWTESFGYLDIIEKQTVKVLPIVVKRFNSIENLIFNTLEKYEKQLEKQINGTILEINVEQLLNEETDRCDKLYEAGKSYTLNIACKSHSLILDNLAQFVKTYDWEYDYTPLSFSDLSVPSEYALLTFTEIQTKKSFAIMVYPLFPIENQILKAIEQYEEKN
ncbi:MAG: hypothetical protein K940chlam5_00298 [Candidatus Anoxychlamydiales bacterium]|nr:hypothetical protein [Candidatus Anoxychlamydiales bacterium]